VAALIRDTPADLEGTGPTGVRTVAVASGRFDWATLRNAGAPTVVSDLRDTELLIKLVHSDRQAPALLLDTPEPVEAIQRGAVPGAADPVSRTAKRRRPVVFR
jgi:hypothetical protein